MPVQYERKRQLVRYVAPHAVERLRERYPNPARFAAMPDPDLRHLLDETVARAPLADQVHMVHDDLPCRAVPLRGGFGEAGMFAVVKKNRTPGYQAEAIVTVLNDWMVDRLCGWEDIAALPPNPSAMAALALARAQRREAELAASLRATEALLTPQPQAPPPEPAKAPPVLDDRTATLAALYQEGHSLAEVAAAAGLCTATVRRRLTDAGVQIRPRGRVPAQVAA
jgi:hypothetical protein